MIMPLHNIIGGPQDALEEACKVQRTQWGEQIAQQTATGCSVLVAKRQNHTRSAYGVVAIRN